MSHWDKSRLTATDNVISAAQERGLQPNTLNRGAINGAIASTSFLLFRRSYSSLTRDQAEAVERTVLVHLLESA